MKKIILLLCTAFISFPSFAGNDRPVDIDRFPTPARDFIALHFKNVKVSLATVDREIFDTTYEVIFTDGQKVEFNSRGDWTDIDCRHSRVPEEAVPERYAIISSRTIPNATSRRWSATGTITR